MRMHLLEETTVRTEWTRVPGPVDAYEIQFIPTTEGASPPFTARVPSSASAYDQRGLAPGQDYQVTVRALRGTSWGPPTSKTITTSESRGCGDKISGFDRLLAIGVGWGLYQSRAERIHS